MVSTDWDRFAADEAARVAVEDELLSAQSDSALGLNRVGTPNGAAEHEEIQKRNALRDAKESWRAREDVAVAQKHFVSDEIGVVRVIASEEVARPRSTSGDAAVPGTHEETPSSSQTPTNAIHVKNCKDCRFTLPPSLKTAKLFVENCVNVTLDVNCMVITQHLEIWGSTGCKLVFTKPVATVQVDSCTDCEIILKNGLEDLGAVVHATCGGFLNLVWSDTTGDESSNESSVDLVLSEKKVTPDEAAKQISKSGVHETPQFITRLINNKPLTEHVVRDKDEYPTTHRELLLDREEAAKGGDTHAQTLIKNNVPIELDTSNERAERRKQLGNDAFKLGDYPQAVVEYSLSLDLSPGLHAVLSNRAACFLKLGEHEKALRDAEACVLLDPTFTKGKFRLGLALHALARFPEAAQVLAEAEALDPKNAQIKDALKMASFKARQQAERG